MRVCPFGECTFHAVPSRVCSVSEVDFGLGIGAKLKLVKTACTHVYGDTAPPPPVAESTPSSPQLRRSKVKREEAAAPAIGWDALDNFGPSVLDIDFCAADVNRYPYPAISPAIPPQFLLSFHLSGLTCHFLLFSTSAHTRMHTSVCLRCLSDSSVVFITRCADSLCRHATAASSLHRGLASDCRRKRSGRQMRLTTASSR